MTTSATFKLEDNWRKTNTCECLQILNKSLEVIVSSALPHRGRAVKWHLQVVEGVQWEVSSKHIQQTNHLRGKRHILHQQGQVIKGSAPPGLWTLPSWRVSHFHVSCAWGASAPCRPAWRRAPSGKVGTASWWPLWPPTWSPGLSWGRRRRTLECVSYDQGTAVRPFEEQQLWVALTVTRMPNRGQY